MPDYKPIERKIRPPSMRAALDKFLGRDRGDETPVSKAPDPPKPRLVHSTPVQTIHNRAERERLAEEQDDPRWLRDPEHKEDNDMINQPTGDTNDYGHTFMLKDVLPINAKLGTTNTLSDIMTLDGGFVGVMIHHDGQLVYVTNFDFKSEGGELNVVDRPSVDPARDPLKMKKMIEHDYTHHNSRGDVYKMFITLVRLQPDDYEELQIDQIKKKLSPTEYELLKAEILKGGE